MADDVEIPYELLNELNGSLKQIIVEFSDAGKRSGALESAIGTPLGRSGLRDQADRFEGEWDDKRETLKRDLEELQKKVDEVGRAWQDWDLEASAQLSVTESASPSTPTRPKAV